MARLTFDPEPREPTGWSVLVALLVAALVVAAFRRWR